MNFKDEYKKSADSISPDREAIDRMKAAVLAKLSEEQNDHAPAIPAKEENITQRKPLPFKRIALIGGTVAACAVITLSVVALLPELKQTGGMVNATASQPSAVESSIAANGADYEMADAADITESGNSDNGYSDNFAPVYPDEIAQAAEAQTEESETTASTTAVTTSSLEQIQSLPTEEYDGGIIADVVEDDAVELETYEVYIENADETTFPATGGTESDIAADSSADNANNADSSAGSNDQSDKSEATITTGTDEALYDKPDYGGTNDVVIDETLEDVVEAVTEEYDHSDETSEVMDETMEIFITEEYTCEAEEDTEEILPKLILSDKGWLTYNSLKYELDSSVKTAMFPLSPVTATNILDGKDYFLYIDGYVIKVFDGQKNFLGLYRMKS